MSNSRTDPLVELLPGSGIVIRRPEFLCVLDESAGELVQQLRDLPQTAAGTDRSALRGRALVTALEQLLEGAGDVDIAFAAPDTVGITLYLRGSAHASRDGRRLAPDSDGMLDRAIPWPLESLTLHLGAMEPGSGPGGVYQLAEGSVPAAGARLRPPLGARGTELLQVGDRWSAEGVAPGPVVAKAEVGAPGAAQPAADEPAAGEPVAAEPVGDAPAAATAGADDPAPFQSTPLGGPDPAPVSKPFQSTPLSGADPAPVSKPFQSTPLGGGPEQPARPQRPEPPKPPEVQPVRSRPTLIEPLPNRPSSPRAPLPVEPHSGPAIASRRPPTESPATPAPPSRPLVLGIRCARGHLNHPHAFICGSCGLRMDQATKIPVEGVRPALGWLLFDTGSTYLLEDDLVLGRAPGHPQPGAPVPMQVSDHGGEVSRRHAEIKLVGWDVQLIDLNSANGTYLTAPTDQWEVRLQPGRPYVLAPGTYVRLGGRHFIFESPHAVI